MLHLFFRSTSVLFPVLLGGLALATTSVITAHAQLVPATITVRIQSSPLPTSLPGALYCFGPDSTFDTTSPTLSPLVAGSITTLSQHMVWHAPFEVPAGNTDTTLTLSPTNGYGDPLTNAVLPPGFVRCQVVFQPTESTTDSLTSSFPTPLPTQTHPFVATSVLESLLAPFQETDATPHGAAFLRIEFGVITHTHPDGTPDGPGSTTSPLILCLSGPECGTQTTPVTEEAPETTAALPLPTFPACTTDALILTGNASAAHMTPWSLSKVGEATTLPFVPSALAYDALTHIRYATDTDGNLWQILPEPDTSIKLGAIAKGAHITGLTWHHPTSQLIASSSSGALWFFSPETPDQSHRVTHPDTAFSALTVHPHTGDLFAFTTTTQSLSQFSSTGEFIRTIPFASAVTAPAKDIQGLFFDEASYLHLFDAFGRNWTADIVTTSLTFNTESFPLRGENIVSLTGCTPPKTAAALPGTTLSGGNSFSPRISQFSHPTESPRYHITPRTPRLKPERTQWRRSRFASGMYRPHGAGDSNFSVSDVPTLAHTRKTARLTQQSTCPERHLAAVKPAGFHALPLTASLPDHITELYQAHSLFPALETDHPDYLPLVSLYAHGIAVDAWATPQALAAPLTRESATVLLARASQATVSTHCQEPYFDVSSTHPEFDTLLHAGHQGWFSVQENRFLPGAHVNGDEFAIAHAKAFTRSTHTWADLLKANLIPGSLHSENTTLTVGQAFHILHRTLAREESSTNTYLEKIHVSVPDTPLNHMPAHNTVLSEPSAWAHTLSSTGGGFTYIDGTPVVFAHSSVLPQDPTPFGTLFEPLVREVPLGSTLTLSSTAFTDQYIITGREIIHETDFESLQLAAERADLVLFTCNEDFTQRVLLKATKVERSS